MEIVVVMTVVTVVVVVVVVVGMPSQMYCHEDSVNWSVDVPNMITLASVLYTQPVKPTPSSCSVGTEPRPSWVAAVVKQSFCVRTSPMT